MLQLTCGACLSQLQHLNILQVGTAGPICEDLYCPVMRTPTVLERPATGNNSNRLSGLVVTVRQSTAFSRFTQLVLIKISTCLNLRENTLKKTRKRDN